MSKKFADYLLRDDVITVFDIDGTLASYEFGENSHCMSDGEWDSKIENGVDLYKDIRSVPLLEEFILKKSSDNVFVCSRANEYEYQIKKAFVLRHYRVDEDKIRFVKTPQEKIEFLRELSKRYTGKKIALIEDTVDTLNIAARNGEYVTAHISSFFDE